MLRGSEPRRLVTLAAMSCTAVVASMRAGGSPVFPTWPEQLAGDRVTFSALARHPAGAGDLAARRTGSWPEGHKILGKNVWGALYRGCFFVTRGISCEFEVDKWALIWG